MKREEDATQRAVATYLAARRILFYAIPNGEFRTVVTGAKLKRLGVSKGVPDLCIPIPVIPYSGMYIELKSAKGRTSEEQRDWLFKLEDNGYRVVVCHSFDHAKKEIDNYLNL